MRITSAALYLQHAMRPALLAGCLVLGACGGSDGTASLNIGLNGGSNDTVAIQFSPNSDTFSVNISLSAETILRNFILLSWMPASGILLDVQGLPEGVSFNPTSNELRVAPSAKPGAYTPTQRFTVQAAGITLKTDARPVSLKLLAASN